MSHFIFRPVLISGRNIGGKLGMMSTFFKSKQSLEEESQGLRFELDSMSAKLANYSSILDENIKLKEILGRKKEEINVILGVILSKPNQSPYDTLIIDVGERHGIKVGDMVLALGSIPVGRVGEVYTSSSKVVLFSNWGEKTRVAISGQDIFMEVIGRGGGNFEMILERDINLPEGTEILLPGIDSYLLAKVETVISDPRDAFNKVLLVSPVNIQELKFVEVRR
ncbi:MAG: rod shape-determining protein MreC [bacterium]|nr:rod shape-determining protein MreC [bacterium]